MVYRSLTVAHEDGVATLTLRRPPTNAINGQVLDEIMAALEAWESDPAVTAVVLTGGIRNAFCTGGDLQQLFGQDMAGLGRDERMALFDRFQRIYSRIEAHPKPTVAAINGVAIGGGLELALVCDLRVASEVAYFSMPELKHGIIPGLGATQRLSRFIGVGRAKEMLFLGRMVRAETALAWGLVDRLVTRDRVLAVACELARDLGGKPASAVRALKECFLQNGDADGLRVETEAFARLVGEQIAGAPGAGRERLRRPGRGRHRSHRGIGRAIALELARQGAAWRSRTAAARIWRTPSRASWRPRGPVARGPGGSADLERVREMVAHTRRELGDIHALVNNAGITRDKLLMMMGGDDWKDVIDTNLTGCSTSVGR